MKTSTANYAHRWLSPKEVAAAIGIHVTRIRRMCIARRLVAKRVPGGPHWRIAVGPDGFPVAPAT